MKIDPTVELRLAYADTVLAWQTVESFLAMLYTVVVDPSYDPTRNVTHSNAARASLAAIDSLMLSNKLAAIKAAAEVVLLPEHLKLVRSACHKAKDLVVKRNALAHGVLIFDPRTFMGFEPADYGEEEPWHWIGSQRYSARPADKKITINEIKEYVLEFVEFAMNLASLVHEIRAAPRKNPLSVS